MPKFVIERSIPSIGSVSAAEMQAISQKSCSVLKDLGVGGEHARRGGFPADSVAKVTRVIDPTTAEPGTLARAA
jgi:hypothetical protein